MTLYKDMAYLCAMAERNQLTEDSCRPDFLAWCSYVATCKPTGKLLLCYLDKIVEVLDCYGGELYSRYLELMRTHIKMVEKEIKNIPSYSYRSTTKLFEEGIVETFSQGEIVLNIQSVVGPSQ